ncbi:hypothetical protein [Pedobacter borealis]|uniref:hypothetical protein n=1 Tax=Pedobacter borealis TaxID=475254 RepID=UPI0004933610|nr:hypothetical protein [Pedobacter borealis]
MRFNNRTQVNSKLPIGPSTTLRVTTEKDNTFCIGSYRYYQVRDKVLCSTQPKIALPHKPPSPDWSEHEAAGKVKRKAGKNPDSSTGAALLIAFI